MITGDLATEMRRLLEAREPFVQATVVRAAAPTSVRPGDAALVLADGTVHGFVGGVCAESSVRLHAARAMETGEPILLRLVPGAEAPAGDPIAQDGVVVVNNPCLSGGALEIFLEPRTPAPRVVVLGETPVAAALADIGPRVGLAVDSGAPADGDLALVVASHGRDELGALRAGLEAGLPYVGLVASRVRGQAVVEELHATGVPEDRLNPPIPGMLLHHDIACGISIYDSSNTVKRLILKLCLVCIVRCRVYRRRDSSSRIAAAMTFSPV